MDYQQPTNRQRILLVLNYFAGYMLLYQYISIIVLWIIKSLVGPLDEAHVNLFVNIFTSCVSIVGTYFIIRPQIKTFFKNKVDFTLVVKTLVAMFVTLIVLGIVMSFFFEVPEADNQVAVETLFTRFPALMLIMITVLAPIIEEFTFRFAMMNFNSPKVTLWISSFFFGFIHILSILQTHDLSQLIHLPVYMSLGYWMGVSYLKDKNIMTPILVHTMYNGFQGVLMLFL